MHNTIAVTPQMSFPHNKYYRGFATGVLLGRTNIIELISPTTFLQHGRLSFNVFTFWYMSFSGSLVEFPLTVRAFYIV